MMAHGAGGVSVITGNRPFSGGPVGDGKISVFRGIL